MRLVILFVVSFMFLHLVQDEAIETLVALRGLPIDHPRVASEFNEIKTQIEGERANFGGKQGSRLGR